MTRSARSQLTPTGTQFLPIILHETKYAKRQACWLAFSLGSAISLADISGASRSVAGWPKRVMAREITHCVLLFGSVSRDSVEHLSARDFVVDEQD